MKKILFLMMVVLLSVTGFTQNVGIGVPAPAEKLDVAGNIKTTGEIKPNGATGQAGEVLTSNGNGTMQWSTAKSAGNANGGWGDCSIYNIDSFRIGVNIDAQVGDGFGTVAAISGNYAIVGAWADDEGGFTNTGSATIYKLNTATGQWEPQQKLTNPDAANDDQFGYAVAISGDYAIVGAFADDDGAVSNSGSVTIFKRNGSGLWENQGKLVNPTPAISDNFGVSVAISNDYAVVGTSADDEGGFTDNGSITIFKRNVTTGVWENMGKLLNISPGNTDFFGYDVSISGDYIIAGAFTDNENGLTDNGSAVIFKRNTITGLWNAQVKLTNPSGHNNDRMGSSVSISGDYAIVGIPLDDDAVNTDNGSAIIYKQNTTTGVWELHNKIFNPSASSLDYFGNSVSITPDYALVGSYYDDENGGSNNGASTLFKRYESVWYPHQKFTNPGYPGVNHYYGTSVSLSTNNWFLVGAPGLPSKGMVFFGKVK